MNQKYDVSHILCTSHKIHVNVSWQFWNILAYHFWLGVNKGDDIPLRPFKIRITGLALKK